jgi:hypothetical protein
MDRNVLPQIIFNSIRYSAVRPEIINMLITKIEEFQLSAFLTTGVNKRVIEILFTHTPSNDGDVTFFGEDWLTYLMELDNEINSMGLGEQFEILYGNFCNHYLDIIGTRSIILGDDSLVDELDIEERASLKFIKMVWFILNNIVSFKECIQGILFNNGSVPGYDENQPIESMDGDIGGYN